MPNTNRTKPDLSGIAILEKILKWVFLIIAVLAGYFAGPDDTAFLCFDALVVVVAVTGSVPKVMTSILRVLSSQ